MSNWAGNPLHQKHSLMGYALPQLLFSECHKYCINPHEFRAAESDSEKTCISNCQSKTYRAFDMYMQVAVKSEAKKDYRSFIDISRYTGMEVEHQHDTASELNHNLGGLHIHANPIVEYSDHVSN
jgi:hypothetical protein